MARIRRANVILTVKDTEVDRYIDLGYVQLDDNGTVIKKGIPSTVEELRKAYKEHEELIAKLQAEIAELKKPAKKSKKVEVEE